MDLDPSTYAALLAAMPQVHTFAVALCRDPDQARDLAQEALLRACANIDRFEAGSNMVAWLVTILRNHYYSEYRKRRREVEDVGGIYAETLVVQPDQIVHLEHEELCAALAKLPSDMRRALLLIGAEGVSYEQAAQACKCSVGTVKSRVHRGRARLAAMLSIDRPADRRDDRSGQSLVGGEKMSPGGTAVCRDLSAFAEPC